MAKSEFGGLNPAPSATQLALFARHKRNGTSPGNPKWYRPQTIKPFVFVANKKPVYPRIESGAACTARHCVSIPPQESPFVVAARFESVAAYVGAFDTAARFVAVRYA